MQSGWSRRLNRVCHSEPVEAAARARAVRDSSPHPAVDVCSPAGGHARRSLLQLSEDMYAVAR